MRNSLYSLALIAIGISPCVALAQDTRFAVGADIHAHTWRGSNGGGDDFSAGSGQLGLQAQIRHKAIFGGLSLLGGTFPFSDGRPNAANSNTATDYTRNELDIIGGYQLWEHLSLYMDIKVVGYAWTDDTAKTARLGALGLGGQWRFPLSARWQSFGHLTLFSGDVEITDADSAGANGSSLAIGAGYALTKQLLLQASINNQRMTFNLPVQQTHEIGGLSFGAHYVF